MRLTFNRWIAVTAAFSLSLTGFVPAQADTLVTLGNSNCDFSAVSQGHGSQGDPFIINSGLDIQEMPECSSRTKTISSVQVGAGIATFTVDNTHGEYGTGQVVSISGTDSGAFDIEVVKVLSATDTTVVTKTSAAGDATTTAGTIVPIHNYFKLGADINLGTSSAETWNNNGSLAITAATKGSDGTITFTAANSLTGGENVFIDGMGDNTFNIGHATVISATSTEFVVSTNYLMEDGSASSAGGKAHFEGWSPVALTNADLDGAGRTISGLTLYRQAANQGLFGSVIRSTIRNLRVVDAAVNTTDNSGLDNYNTGAIAGRSENSIFNRVSITSSSVLAGGDSAGLLSGNLNNVSISDSSVAGNVSVASKVSELNQLLYAGRLGGFAGSADYVTMTNSTSSATVNASLFSQSASVSATQVPIVHHFLRYVGGIVGRVSEFEARNISASGNITGGSYVGGAFGDMSYDGELINASSTGNVVAESGAGTNYEVRYVGGFAGALMGESDNVNVSSTGSVTVTVPVGSQASIHEVGGLAGRANCCGSNNELNSSGAVIVTNLGDGETSQVGGMMGYNSCCLIVSNSESTSSVTITSAVGAVTRVGGFVGYWGCCGIDRQNTSTGDVNVSITDTTSNWASQIGGYVGASYGYGAMSHITSSSNVTVTNGSQIGGFAGSLGEQASYHDITVTGNVNDTYADDSRASSASRGYYANVGGFAGFVNGRVLIERVGVSNTVVVEGLRGGTPSSIGGLVGGNTSRSSGPESGPVEIINSFFRGAVSGGNYVAGLFGRASSSPSYRLEGNFIAASVTASAPNAVTDPVMNGYFLDTSESNFFDSSLAGGVENFPLFNAASTANMKLEATYTSKGWTFDGNSPWRIEAASNGGYPYLTVPANDDSRSQSGWSYVDRIVNRTVDNVVEKNIDRVVEKKVQIVYTTINSVSFKGRVLTLTSAQKKSLTAAARKIATSSYTNFVISATPGYDKLPITTARVVASHDFLQAALRKLKSKKQVDIMLSPNATSKSTRILIQQGK